MLAVAHKHQALWFTTTALSSLPALSACHYLIRPVCPQYTDICPPSLMFPPTLHIQSVARPGVPTTADLWFPPSIPCLHQAHPNSPSAGPGRLPAFPSATLPTAGKVLSPGRRSDGTALLHNFKWLPVAHGSWSSRAGGQHQLRSSGSFLRTCHKRGHFISQEAKSCGANFALSLTTLHVGTNSRVPEGFD